MHNACRLSQFHYSSFSQICSRGVRVSPGGGRLSDYLTHKTGAFKWPTHKVTASHSGFGPARLVHSPYWFARLHTRAHLWARRRTLVQRRPRPRPRTTTTRTTITTTRGRPKPASPPTAGATGAAVQSVCCCQLYYTESKSTAHTVVGTLLPYVDTICQLSYVANCCHSGPGTVFISNKSPYTTALLPTYLP